jgi:Ca2+-binding EF-hand superfamily protein
MTNRSAAIRLTVISTAVLLLAGVAGAPPALADAEEDFALTDRNSNGFIDKGEFHQRMVELFFFADTDRDGRLVPAELRGVPAEVFRGADRNSDGSLSLIEFTEARAVDFGQVDRDGDGLLSRQEVDAVVPPGVASPQPGTATPQTPQSPKTPQPGTSGRAAR